MNQDDMNQIVPLSELDDFKVADGDPDIRGWDVMTQDGRTVGEVDELLVDTSAMKVRYIAIDLDDDVAGSDRKVLVPIGAAQLDADDERVLVIGISAEQFATLPEYRREAFDRDFETSLLSSYDGERDTGRAADTAQVTSTGSSPTQDDLYASRLFDDQNFFGAGRGPREARVTRSEEELSIGKRQVQAGDVEVRKTVEMEEVQSDLRREPIDVDERGRTKSSRAAIDKAIDQGLGETDAR